MIQEEHNAILNSKVNKLVTMDMVSEHWYPENIPYKENGEVDFKQFEILWKQEIEKRRYKYIQEALIGDDYDVYSHDGRTPNIDRIISEREEKSNYVDEVPMHHNR